MSGVGEGVAVVFHWQRVLQAVNKQKHNPTRRPRLTLRDKPFAQLVVSVQELTEARREYAGKSPEERRAAGEE